MSTATCKKMVCASPISRNYFHLLLVAQSILDSYMLRPINTFKSSNIGKRYNGTDSKYNPSLPTQTNETPNYDIIAKILISFTHTEREREREREREKHIDD